MLDLKFYFKRAGGLNLLQRYWRSGVLGTAIIQFILLGKSKTALLLLREIITLKTQQKLRRKYSYILDDFENKYVKQPHKGCRRVWIFWWQGIENAPALVQKCYASVKDNLADWKITLITEQNFQEYASFPKHIMEKLKNGQITLTHFSDLLRLELLINHGGLWLDATVLCTNGDIPNSILNSDLFYYQVLKPGADGRPIVMSSWCMYAKTNNKILMATRELLYHYWERENFLVDYFLVHQFFSISCDYYPSETKTVPPYCSSIPHILLLHLFDEYNEQYWTDLKKLTCFHKLSYKLDKQDMAKNGTYFDVILNKSL